MDKGFELLEKLSMLQWLLQRQRHRVRLEAGPVVDPTCGQGRILAMLKLKDGVSTKDLSTVLGIGVSSLNEMLAKLEKGGYVERRPSEEDKRVMLVTLTQQGRDADQAEDASTSLFSCLTDDEQEQLGAYLDRLIASLEDAMGEDGRASFERARRHRDEMFSRFRGGEGFDGQDGPYPPHGFGGGRGGFGGPRDPRRRDRRDRSGRDGGLA